ncbi:FAD-binding monooxygenase [Aspergillus sergii]|uniref:FAD-binding monooxygenase n=1 Tax=Aspergillus sergii TaxID=1034303 RepID=A0A5N6WR99_9EURO|nr:FAD-binding monooxygenase [Aspergillus sergii]
MGSIQIDDTIQFSPGPLIVGAGPVGMLTALRLAQLGVPCTLCEMNTETTYWPKMDHNSCHTMEVLRIMGLVEEYRQQPGAVPQHSDWDPIFFNTCGLKKKLVSRWIHANNDGSQPAEPGQRCSQIVLEAFLKKRCLAEPLITTHFGYKFVSLGEDNEGATATFRDMDNHEKMIRTPYLVGADGAQSRVRKSVGIQLQGRPLPAAFFMVHFQSKELTKLSPFCKWWHAFGLHGGFMIDQDDVDTYTCHEPCSADAATIRKLQEHPEETPYRVPGSLGKPYKFKIDKIMLANAWRPNFGLADSYVSRDGHGRVFLCGDAAYRNAPHGGYI